MREFFESLAPLYLIIALSVTAWASYKARSRKYIFLIMVASLGYLGFFHHGCVCSVGSIQNVVLLFLDKNYVLPFLISTAFILPLVAAYFWGRVFCGGVCPLGAMQDLVNVFRLKIPHWLDPVLRLFPVTYLFLTVIFLINGAGFLICEYDPFISFIRLNGSFSMILLSVIGLSLSMVVSRPYCRYLCPYGVLLGWISRFSRRKVSITPRECEKCHLCKDACPVEAIEKPTTLKGSEKQKTGLWWMIAFIVMFPLWMTAFGFIGARLAAPVEILEEIEKIQKKQEKKFTSKRAEQLEELVYQSSQNNNKGAATGVLFGWLWGLTLMSFVVKRERDEYKANSSSCVVCGRCYNYCPVEIEIRDNKKIPGLKDRILDHLADRMVLSDKVKQKMSIGALFLAGVLGLSIFVMMGNIKNIENGNILKQKELTRMKAELRKNPKNEALQTEYAQKESAAREYYDKEIDSHKRNVLFVMISFFSIAFLLNIRNNLKALTESVKEEPAAVSPVFSVTTRLGAVLTGILLLVLGFIFSIKPF